MALGCVRGGAFAKVSKVAPETETSSSAVRGFVGGDHSAPECVLADRFKLRIRRCMRR